MAKPTDLPRDVLSSIEESLEHRGELRAEELELGWGLTRRESERVLLELSRRRDEECTIIDCVDDYRGSRPQLGYEAFREVWYPQIGKPSWRPPPPPAKPPSTPCS